MIVGAFEIPTPARNSGPNSAFTRSLIKRHGVFQHPRHGGRDGYAGRGCCCCDCCYEAELPGRRVCPKVGHVHTISRRHAQREPWLAPHTGYHARLATRVRGVLRHGRRMDARPRGRAPSAAVRAADEAKWGQLASCLTGDMDTQNRERS